MAADSKGNDLESVDVVITAAFAIAPYAQENVLTSEQGGAETADLPAAYRPVGLIKSDGGATESAEAGDAIEFLQDGYTLNGDSTMTIQLGLAEFNATVRELTTGKTADANGMIAVETYTPDTKWIGYYEEVYRSGRVRRLNGVVQVTATEIDQSERGSVKGRNVTLTWKTDPWIGNGKTTKYLEWHWPVVDAATVSLTPAELTVQATKTATLTAKVTPAGAALTAKSSDETKATVAVNGTTVTVTGKAATDAGKPVTVSVTAGGGTAVAKVTVTA